eukprot:481013-Pyramimonas_sp.AAC.1
MLDRFHLRLLPHYASVVPRVDLVLVERLRVPLRDVLQGGPEGVQKGSKGGLEGWTAVNDFFVDAAEDRSDPSKRNQ